MSDLVDSIHVAFLHDSPDIFSAITVHFLGMALWTYPCDAAPCAVPCDVATRVVAPSFNADELAPGLFHEVRALADWLPAQGDFFAHLLNSSKLIGLDARFRMAISIF